jgi:hypothetical protein
MSKSIITINGRVLTDDQVSVFEAMIDTIAIILEIDDKPPGHQLTPREIAFSDIRRLILGDSDAGKSNQNH